MSQTLAHPLQDRTSNLASSSACRYLKSHCGGQAAIALSRKLPVRKRRRFTMLRRSLRHARRHPLRQSSPQVPHHELGVILPPAVHPPDQSRLKQQDAATVENKGEHEKPTSEATADGQNAELKAASCPSTPPPTAPPGNLVQTSESKDPGTSEQSQAQVQAKVESLPEQPSEETLPSVATAGTMGAQTASSPPAPQTEAPPGAPVDTTESDDPATSGQSLTQLQAETEANRGSLPAPSNGPFDGGETPSGEQHMCFTSTAYWNTLLQCVSRYVSSGTTCSQQALKCLPLLSCSTRPGRAILLVMVLSLCVGGLATIGFVLVNHSNNQSSLDNKPNITGSASPEQPQKDCNSSRIIAFRCKSSRTLKYVN